MDDALAVLAEFVGVGEGRRANACAPDDVIPHLHSRSVEEVGSTGHWKHYVPKQRPCYAFIVCSDSRTSPEITFGFAPGECFVVRTAGSLVSDDVIGSIEYAVAVLGVRNIVVATHHDCGAVDAARRKSPGSYPGKISSVVQGVLDVCSGSSVEMCYKTPGLYARKIIDRLVGASKIVNDLWASAAGDRLRLFYVVYDTTHSAMIEGESGETLYEPSAGSLHTKCNPSFPSSSEEGPTKPKALCLQCKVRKFPPLGQCRCSRRPSSSG